MRVFDLHIGYSDSEIVSLPDAPKQFDCLLAQQGGVEVFCGMMCPVVYENGAFALPSDSKSEVQKHIQIYEDLMKEGRLSIVYSRNDLKKKGLKVILGLEGAYFIRSEKDLEFLQESIDRGIRIIGPRWNFESTLFPGNTMTSLGEKFLKLCSIHNIVIDLAHSENSIFNLVCNIYHGPIIDSHTNLYSIRSHPRNIKSDQMSVIVKRGGLIGISFVGEFLGGNRLFNVFQNIKTFLDTFGDENLAIGSDFCGMDQSDVVNQLEDASKYNSLQTFLLKNGIGKQTVEKLLYNNADKFFRRIL